jgi:hypothetical protein
MTTKFSMLLGSLDHTPSEQLSDLSQWHTTALVMSEGGEHWQQLPEDLASRMGLKGESLNKWAGRNRPDYKSKFERELLSCVNAYPVHIRVVSAQGSTIKDFFPTILSDLGISSLVRSTVSSTKLHLEFGPFTRVVRGGASEPWICKIPEGQAIPLLFICYFLFRAHRDIMSIIQSEKPGIEWLDWQLMHNKFPGDVHGPMGSLFGAIMTGAVHAGLVAGTMRIGTFNEAKEDRGNLLADNIAGLFADKLQRGDRNINEPTKRGQGASLSWEIWERSEPPKFVAS